MDAPCAKSNYSDCSLNGIRQDCMKHRHCNDSALADSVFECITDKPSFEKASNPVFFKNPQTCVIQECIPVGCVSSAAGGVSGQGCLSRGCLPRGCLPKGCLPGGCLPQGVGVSAHGSVCLGGVCQNPPVNRITDRCCSNEIVKFVCFRNTNLGKLQIADEITKLNVLHYVQRILNKGSLTANPLIHIYIDYLTQKM